MAEIKLNTKGPLGVVLGILILGGIIYYQFLMPVHLGSREKREILDEIRDIKMAEVAKLTGTTVQQYKATGKVANSVTGKIKQLSGKLKLDKIESKRSIFSGTKIKVTYTIDGKTPKDGGVVYLKLYRRQRSSSGRRRNMNIYRITKSEYNK